MEGDPASTEVHDELRLAELRYRSIVESMATFLWVTDPAGRPKGDLDAWMEITGQTEDELEGSGWLDALHPEDRRRITEAWRHSLATASPYSVEFRLRDRAGAWRTMLVRGIPIVTDGELQEFVGVGVDISERERLASALEQERIVLQAVVDEMPVGVALIWGEDWVYRLVNRRYYDLVPTRDLLGRSLREAFPEAYDVARAILDPVFRGETVHQEDVPVEWADSPMRYYRVTAVPIPGPDGSVQGALSVAVETTEEVVERARLRERLEHERGTAETLQRALLPQTIPTAPGVEVAVRYQPGDGEMLVGGDFYELLELGESVLGVAVGDVAGRGVRAAAVMGQLRAAVRAYAAEVPDDPAGVIARASEFFWRFEPGEMATLAYACANGATRTMSLSMAGHLPPLVIVPEAAARFAHAAGSPPLGATGDRFGVERIGPLPAGSTVVLFTDGLVERRDESIDAGLERLRSAVAGHETAPLEALCDHLMDATGGNGREDDLAVLAVRFT